MTLEVSDIGDDKESMKDMLLGIKQVLAPFRALSLVSWPTWAGPASPVSVCPSQSSPKDDNLTEFGEKLVVQ